MQHNGWDHGLTVTADGNGLAGHAGGVLLRKLADRCGLTAALEAALTQRGMFPQFSRGVVLVSTAIALGATAMADIAVLGQLAPVLGPATSASTVRRTLNLASDRVLVRIAQARARIRAHVWQQIQDAGSRGWRSPASPLPGSCSSTWTAPWSPPTPASKEQAKTDHLPCYGSSAVPVGTRPRSRSLSW
jgi:hypothetical protein